MRLSSRRRILVFKFVLTFGFFIRIIKSWAMRILVGRLSIFDLFRLSSDYMFIIF